MPKYQIGDQNFYRSGKLYTPGTIITLPPEVEPSSTWTPLDDDAKKAMAKLKKGRAEREALAAAKNQQMDGKQLDAVIENLVAKRVEAALAAALAGEKKGKAKQTEVEVEAPPKPGGRAADHEPV